jgi:hypothetical protein
MNSANGIMLRIQQSDERSAIARAAHMNRGATVATAEKRGEWMEAALLRADRELACFRLAIVLLISVLRGESDNKSPKREDRRTGRTLDQLRKASVALEFAVRTVSTTAAYQESQCKSARSDNGCLGETLILALNADFSRIEPRDEYRVRNRKTETHWPPDRGD